MLDLNILFFLILFFTSFIINLIILKIVYKENKIKKDYIYKEIDYYNNENKEKYSECTICQDDYEEYDICLELFCSHKYHHKCLEEWFNYDKEIMRCPLCNLSVMTKNNKRINEMRD